MTGTAMAAVQYGQVLVAGVATFLLVIIVRRLRRPDPLASFRQQPEAAIRDFELLTGAAVLMFAAFAATAVAGLLASDTLLLAARVLEVAFFVGATAVFHRWWGRFR